MTPIHDRLCAVVGSEAHATRPSPRAGGEWDPWRHLTRKKRRVLIGAGWARPEGMPPDVLADLICRSTQAESACEALEWFYRTALAAIAERRTEAQRLSRLATARRHGHSTHYRHRVALAQAAGFESLWAYRQDRGWP